jgi:predicted metal-binding protein
MELMWRHNPVELREGVLARIPEGWVRDLNNYYMV